MTNSEGRKADILNRLVKNSFFLVVSRISDVGVVLITTPIIARYLGLKAFGDYALVMAITIFVKPLAEFGAESIICRDVAKSKDNASEYVNAAFVARALMSGFTIATIYLFLGLFVHDTIFKYAIFISSVTEIVIAFSTVSFAVIRAYERMEYELICNFFHKFIFITVTVFAVSFDLGFLALFYTRLFAALIFLLLSTFFVFRYLVVFRRGFKWQFVGLIFREAFPLAIFTLLVTASSKIDVFFLKHFKGSVDIALFEVPNRLITQLQFITFSINISMFPFFAQISEDPSESLRIHYEKAVKFLYIFSIFPATIVFLGAEAIIGVLFGDKFISSVIPLKILSWTFIFFTLNHFLHNVLIVLGKQRIITIVIGVSFLFNVLLDFLLIPPYGYIGASIATLVSSFILFIFTVVFITVYAGRINASNIIVKPSVGILLTGVICYLIIKKSIVSLFVGAISGLSLYVLLLLSLKVFDRNELGMIKEVIFRRKKLIVNK